MYTVKSQGREGNLHRRPKIDRKNFKIRNRKKREIVLKSVFCLRLAVLSIFTGLYSFFGWSRSRLKISTAAPLKQAAQSVQHCPFTVSVPVILDLKKKIIILG